MKKKILQICKMPRKSKYQEHNEGIIDRLVNNHNDLDFARCLYDTSISLLSDHMLKDAEAQLKEFLTNYIDDDLIPDCETHHIIENFIDDISVIHAELENPGEHTYVLFGDMLIVTTIDNEYAEINITICNELITYDKNVAFGMIYHDNKDIENAYKMCKQYCKTSVEKIVLYLLLEIPYFWHRLYKKFKY